MANKYIRHGETYCGDGTTSAAAASNGGVGAWNNINVFEDTAPAYGSLSAGDVVHIRSKDNTGADITRTLAASNINVGSTAATVSNPITWILDDGTKWPGIVGVLTYQSTVTARGIVLNAYNRVISKIPGNLHVEYTGTSPGDNTQLVGYGFGCTSFGLKTSNLNVSTSTPRLRHHAVEDGCIIESPIVKCGLMSSQLNGASGVFVQTTTKGRFIIIDPDVELTSNAGLNGNGVLYMECGGTYSMKFEVYGGRIYGAGAVSGQHVVNINGASSNNNSISMVGCQFPRSMDVMRGGYISGGNRMSGSIEIFGCDDGGVGGHLEEAWGWATSRTDTFPPYLNALLPDSANTPWAWRIWPRQASQRIPMRMVASKLFTGTAAAKTITQEVLIATTMSCNANNLWVTIEYTDNATGLPKHITTQDYEAGALSSSTAGWSATTWGASSFNKVKFEATTPTAVKQDTPITLTLWGTVQAATADDILFSDPDFLVT